MRGSQSQRNKKGKSLNYDIFLRGAGREYKPTMWALKYYRGKRADINRNARMFGWFNFHFNGLLKCIWIKRLTNHPFLTLSGSLVAIIFLCHQHPSRFDAFHLFAIAFSFSIIILIFLQIYFTLILPRIIANEFCLSIRFERMLAVSLMAHRAFNKINIEKLKLKMTTTRNGKMKKRGQ